ncbi:MAG: hypothetical protein F9K29_10115 [Hyphomicrobiaceae bacterium]|nr:MAG: hypothetical protein F9K29_10115 [Hyphomicrobiaceae bacterium]
MTTRGWIGATVLMLAGAGLALGWLSSRPSAARDLMLLYVGAEDCAPCRSWQGTEAMTFRASPEFARIVYREVKAPTLRDVLKDEYWPDDLRTYRDRLGRGAGVPLWLVIADERIVQQSFGESQWRNSVLPKIRSLIR